jgi:tetratricopeptide (TPR) repeat protein
MLQRESIRLTYLFVTHDEARSLLKRAVTIDPDFAAAHACLAVTHVNDYINGWVESPEGSLQTGLEIAERAIQIDDEDPHAHVWFAVGLLWHRQHDRALAEVQRCLDLAPSLTEGHMTMASIQVFRGDAAAAIDAIDTCMGFDPLSPDLTLYFLAEARISLGQSTRRLRPSNSGWSAIPIQGHPMLSLHRAMATSVELPKARQHGRRL